MDLLSEGTTCVYLHPAALCLFWFLFRFSPSLGVFNLKSVLDGVYN